MFFFYVNKCLIEKFDNNNEIRNVEIVWLNVLLIIIFNGLLKIDIKEKEMKEMYFVNIWEFKLFVNQH